MCNEGVVFCRVRFSATLHLEIVDQLFDQQVSARGLHLGHLLTDNSILQVLTSSVFFGVVRIIKLQ